METRCKIREILDPDLDFSKITRLISYCQKNRYLFCDKEFPPEPESLFGRPAHPEYTGQFQNIVWRRAREILPSPKPSLFNSISPTDILQGALGNCYFLCSLSALAEHPELVRRLFEFDELNEFGVIGVWLNINGGWRQFVLDEYLPVALDKSPPSPAFARTAENELWAMALEKAYAKAYGSYFAIIGGDPVHALRDLTGAPYERIDDFGDADAVWKKLIGHNDRNFIFACWTKSAETAEEKSREGLVSGHAYAILDLREVIDSKGSRARILQIRNPWGRFEWDGAFSDNSPLWTPGLKAELRVQSKDDGIFWMRLDDFAQQFAGIGILKVRPRYFSDSVTVDQGNNNKVYKSVVRISVPGDTLGTISLDQIDSRIADRPDYSYQYFRVTLIRVASSKLVETVASVTSPDRNIFIEVELLKGNYLVLVESYFSTDLIQRFCIGAYTRDRVELEVLNLNVSAYNSLEHMAWKTFLMNNKSKLTPTSQRKIEGGKGPINLELFKYKTENGLFVLYCTFNNSSAEAVQQIYKFVTISGYDVAGGNVNHNGADLLINPLSVDFFMLKMNPIFQSFKVSHQISDEIVLPNLISENFSVIDMVQNMCGKHEMIQVVADFVKRNIS